MILDLSKKGLLVYFKPWQLEAMRVVWKYQSVDSRRVYDALKGTEHEVSRASIINFLNGMLSMGWMDSVEERVKGGLKRRYIIEPYFTTEEHFAVSLVNIICKRLREEFPIENIDVKWA